MWRTVTGFAKTIMWAIKCVSTAVQVFRINNQDTADFTDVCETILKLVIDALRKDLVDSNYLAKIKDQVHLIS